MSRRFFKSGPGVTVTPGAHPDGDCASAVALAVSFEQVARARRGEEGRHSPPIGLLKLKGRMIKNVPDY
jgi:hypothetical protein